MNRPLIRSLGKQRPLLVRKTYAIALLPSRSWNQIILTSWNTLTQTNKKQKQKKTLLIFHIKLYFDPPARVWLWLHVAPSGDLYCRSRWISFTLFTINTTFKWAAFDNLLLARLGSDPHAENSPTLHHSRRAAGSAITQRRFLSPHFHRHPHLKALGLRSGTGPLDSQTCFRGQVRRESSFILSVASSVLRGETSFEILPFKWNITRFYNTRA